MIIWLDNRRRNFIRLFVIQERKLITGRGRLFNIIYKYIYNIRILNLFLNQFYKNIKLKKTTFKYYI